MPAEDAAARSPERAVVRLSCGAAPEALCQALMQAVAEAARRSPAFRRVDRGDERPARSGDIGLALVVQDTAADRLAGHLEWQTRDGVRRTGPDLRLVAFDATLTPQSYASFARDLLRATPEIGAILADPASK